MTIEALIIWLIVGGVAGWLAGQVMKGGGFGLIGDIVLGIVGAFVAGLLLPAIGMRSAAESSRRSSTPLSGHAFGCSLDQTLAASAADGILRLAAA